LDELGLEWVVDCELLQGLVQGQDVLRRLVGAEGVEFRVLAAPAAAVLGAALAAGGLHQDGAPPLRGGRRGSAGGCAAGGSPARGSPSCPPPTSRMYASWTSAVASRVCPGFS